MALKVHHESMADFMGNNLFSSCELIFNQAFVRCFSSALNKYRWTSCPILINTDCRRSCINNAVNNCVYILIRHEHNCTFKHNYNFITMSFIVNNINAAQQRENL